MDFAALFAAMLEAAQRIDIDVADRTPPSMHAYAVNDLSLNLLDWGGDERPPMLLLHGALLHAHVWDFFSLQMRQRFHIRAVDLPGHGDSGWAADGEYSRARVVNDMVALIEQLDLQNLTLIGHSFGGAVGAMVAARLPERVRALVMVDTTLEPSGVPSVRTRAAAGPHVFATFGDFVTHAAGLGRRRKPEELAPSLRWNSRQMEDGTWSWKYDPAMRHTSLGPGNFDDVWSALRTYAGPVLYVRAGERSHLTDSAAERLRELPTVRFVVVPNAAHNVMSDNPVVFFREVNTFLETVKVQA
jgi:esterase